MIIVNLGGWLLEGIIKLMITSKITRKYIFTYQVYIQVLLHVFNMIIMMFNAQN